MYEWLLQCSITMRWTQKKLWHFWGVLWAMGMYTVHCTGLHAGAVALTSVSLFLLTQYLLAPKHPNSLIYIAGTIFVILSESICSNWPLIQFIFVPVIEQNITGQQYIPTVIHTDHTTGRLIRSGFWNILAGHDVTDWDIEYRQKMSSITYRT